MNVCTNPKKNELICFNVTTYWSSSAHKEKTTFSINILSEIMEQFSFISYSGQHSHCICSCLFLQLQILLANSFSYSILWFLTKFIYAYKHTVWIFNSSAASSPLHSHETKSDLQHTVISDWPLCRDVVDYNSSSLQNVCEK